MKKFYLFLLITLLLGLCSKINAQQGDENYKLSLSTGQIVPQKGFSPGWEIQTLFLDKHYFILQFYSNPNQLLKQKLNSGGIFLGKYLGNLCYWAECNKYTDKALFHTPEIRSIFELPAQFKIDRRLLSPLTDASWAISNDRITIRLLCFSGFNPSTLTKWGNQIISLKNNNDSSFWEVSVPVILISELSKFPLIQWIEPVPPPREGFNLPGKTMHGSTYIGDLKSYGLTGNGIIVGEWDGGYIGNHADFENRFARIDSLVYSDHATHVAGTIASAGILNPYATGMAPKAFIYSSDFYDDIPAEMDTVTKYKNIHITNNSYGYSPSYDPCPKSHYDSESERIDKLVRDYPWLTHAFAAGNSQTACSGGYRTVSSGYNSSKNVLTVGAVDYKGGMSSFSSWGPSYDGRLKPEISAVGVGVYSTLQNDAYAGGWNGTSMATPGTSGTLAQLFELYKTKFNTNPDASTLRAIVCNTSTDAGNLHADYKYGYGILNSVKAAAVIDSIYFLTDTVSDSNYNVKNIYVPYGTKDLRFFCAWTDVEGNPAASKALVNDLDMWVITPAGDTVRPWILNPASPSSSATRGIDTLNNHEQVTIDNPDSGTYQVIINGTIVPDGPQLYTLTWYIQGQEIRVIYPNGNENFKPGESQTIRWLATAPPSTFNLYYSTDSGANWTTITTTLNSSYRYYDWTVPNVTSSNVLIKVVSGSLKDSSNFTFNITGQITSLTAKNCNGLVRLNWASNGLANIYRIYRNDIGGQGWKLIDSTVAGTTQWYDRNVLNGISYAYYVSFVTSAGLESQRSLGVKATPTGTTSDVITVPGNMKLYCGDSVTLSGMSGISYLWNTGDTTASIIIKKPGTYSLTVYIDGSCYFSSDDFIIKPNLVVNAVNNSVCYGLTTQLYAESPQLNTLRFTEIIQNRTGTGSAVTYPSWLTGGANADYTEISNVGTDTISAAGLVFEMWNDTGMMQQYMYPDWVLIPPGKTSVLHIGSGATTDSTQLFFNTGGTDDRSGSGDLRGYILKDSNGLVIDVVATNGYKFPVGNIYNDYWNNSGYFSISGLAGMLMKGYENDRIKDWSASSTSNRVSPGSYNAGIATIPSATISWTDSNIYNVNGNYASSLPIVQNISYTGILQTANCIQSAATYITMSSPGTPTVTDSYQCGAGIPSAMATGAYTIKWYSDSTGGTLLQTGDSTFLDSIQSTTIFWVCLDDGTCEGPRIAVKATVYSIPSPVSIQNLSGKKCAGEQVTLKAVPSAADPFSYSWNGNTVLSSSSDTAIITASENTWYKLTATDTITNCVVYDSLLVQIIKTPELYITNTSNSFCDGDSLKLVAGDTLSSWKTNRIIIYYDASAGNAALSGASSVYFHSGISDTDTVNSVIRHETGNWGNDDGLGKMDSLGNDMWSITLDLADYYNITHDTSVQFIQCRFRNSDGTVTGLNSNSLDFFIPINGKYMFQSPEIGFEYIHKYAWYQNGNFISDQNSIYINDSGSYQLTDEGLACFGYSNTVYINKIFNPFTGQIQLSNDTICNGDSVNIYTNLYNGTLTWYYNNGGNFTGLPDSSSSQYFTPVSATQIFASASVSGCPDAFSDTLNLYMFTPVNHASVMSSRNYFCEDTATFFWTGTGGSVTDWIISHNSNYTSTGYSSNPQSIHLSDTAFVLAQISDANGCGIIYDSVLLFVNPAVYHSQLSYNHSGCKGDSIYLMLDSLKNATAGYFWFDNFANAEQDITVNPDDIQLNINPSLHMLNTTNRFYVKLYSNGVFCSDTITDTVYILNKSKMDAGSFTVSDDSVCYGSVINLLYTSGGSGYFYHQWVSSWEKTDSSGNYMAMSGGAISASDTIFNNTQYRIGLMDGCDTVYQNMDVYVYPKAQNGNFTMGADTICNGSGSFMSVNGYTGTISWEYRDISGMYIPFSSADSVFLSPTYTTVYRYKIVGLCDTFISNLYTLYMVNPEQAGTILLSKNQYCFGETAMVKLINYTGNPRWELYDTISQTWGLTGVQSDSFSLTVTGHYIYRAMVGNSYCGYTYSNPDTIKMSSGPVAGKIVYTSPQVCIGTPALLVLNSYQQGNIRWQEYDRGNAQWVNIVNATNDSVWVYPYDTSYYRVRVTLNGCIYIADSIYLTTRPTPSANVTASGPTTFCEGKQVTLNGQTGTGYQYAWMRNGAIISGQNAYKLDVIQDGIYRLIVALNNGCKDTSGSISVTVNPNPPVPVITRTGNYLTVGLSGYSMQWYNNSIPIPGADSAGLTINTGGSYSIKITNNFGCSSVSLPYTNTGMELQSDGYTTVYPNPTTQYIHIYSSRNESVICYIKDISGKTIGSEKLNGNGMLDLTDMAKGLYILELIHPDGVREIFRIVKQ